MGHTQKKELVSHGFSTLSVISYVMRYASKSATVVTFPPFFVGMRMVL